MNINHKIIVALLFLSMVGICAGAFFEVYLTDDIKDQLAPLLETLSHHKEEYAASVPVLQSFSKAIKGHILFIVISFVSPYILLTLPLLPLLIFFRGTAAGFSAAITLETLGLRGLFHIALYMLPPYLLLIPACCILTALSTEAAMINGLSHLFPSDPGLHRKRKALQLNARQYFFYYLIFTGVIILSCLLEAFLLQIRI
ncbi:MAG: stage II sporulation protein M [Firmicutes bacterium]|nr:stage II sporulation protein M [Bacillota bacterium]